MTELAHALIAQRNGDDDDADEWITAIAEAQYREDIRVLRCLVESFLTKK